MSNIGPGAKEIRVQVADRAFRVIDVASFASVIYALHAFQKTTRNTSRRDLRLARRRYRDVVALDGSH